MTDDARIASRESLSKSTRANPSVGAGARLLVTWGSKLGGTEGIGQTLACALADRGFDVTAVPVDDADQGGIELEGFRAVIVGGALYSGHWPANVRRFVNRHVDELRRVPVWFFSSGPLDSIAGNMASLFSDLHGDLGHRHRDGDDAVPVSLGGQADRQTPTLEERVDALQNG